MTRSKTLTILLFIFLNFCCLLFVKAQCVNQTKKVSALISVGNDSGQKTPLILIHGIHETATNEDQTKINQSWDIFISKFTADRDLTAKYALYLFQYHSNQKLVQDIACELGFFIDEKIPDRPHVILAHSMGGLVAKAYMVYYRHKTGKWVGALGGDSVLGAITLATPHHGTHGANDTDALKQYMGLGWKSVIGGLNFAYWSSRTEFFSPQSIASGNPNRGDLRWDNYDKAISANSLTNNDVNVWLPNANNKFEQFSAKVILYAGEMRFENQAKSPQSAVAIATGNPLYNNHQRLSFANDVLINGYSNKFGSTDGLVPYKSALLCDVPPYLISSTTPNFICVSKYKIRRFEVGNVDALASEFPDSKTLSIKRKPNGYDHEQMYQNIDVLRYVVADLKGFIKNPKQETPLPAVPQIPTLFLFDVSGSMSENNKIEQARVAGLRALGELKENRRLGLDNSPVSIWAFSGDCQPQTARQILPFTPDLGRAETAMRVQIPNPDGGTPLPQAIDRSVAQMLSYLTANPNISIGRIIVLSDGQSTCGEIRPAGIYSQAKLITFNKKVNFLTIGYDIQAGSQAERDLQYLASASGGRYFPANNGQQLSRAFEKSIRIYLPKNGNSSNADFERGVQAILNRDFVSALQIWTIYVQENPNDALGFYNLALACEALELSKRAAENYRAYLSLTTSAVDAAEVALRIKKAEDDYRDKLYYYANLLRSDLAYLKAYYQRLFGVKNAELAAEFAGFVDEKRGFYATLPEILEFKLSWLKRSSIELNDSLNRLNNRVNLPSFDRDAVSLLTLPIAQLEELIERLDEHNAQKFK